MSRRAWAYIWGVLIFGVAFAVIAFISTPRPGIDQWIVLAVLIVATTVAQAFESEAPGRQSYYPHLVFMFAGVLLLQPLPFVVLVVVPHVAEWARKRAARSQTLRSWYLQPFNIATHLIAGLTARLLFVSLLPQGHSLDSWMAIIVAAVSALTYALLNHLLIGLALVFARSIALKESGIFELSNVMGDLVQLYFGYAVALLWRVNAWLVIPALSPLVLIYQALKVPQLKKEAQTDDKTGLFNLRHFTELASAELERARRFERPLAMVMGDLDLLRNINNTYGHLAGDTVLTGVGQAIREMSREYDIAARFGGEEFCIVLPEASPEEAVAFTDRLRQAISERPFVVTTSVTPIHATISLGIAAFPGDATTLKDLIHQADMAVYQAKLNGRNCVVCASAIPRSAKLETQSPEDRLSVQYRVPYAVRPESEPREGDPPDATKGPSSKGGPPAGTAGGQPPAPKPMAPMQADARLPHKPRVFRLFVVCVIALGVVVAVVGTIAGRPPDLVTIAMLAFLAILGELFQVNLYGENTVSVSVAVVFAGALIAGVFGVVAVSAAIVLTHTVLRRPLLYKILFNWATHTLAGSLVALASFASPVAPSISYLLVLLAPAAVLGYVYFGAETSLITVAMSLEKDRGFVAIWREQFSWLARYYVTLGVMGLVLAVAYASLGLWGVLVFFLPSFMMHFAQKQYVERTTQSVTETRRMNEELATANQEILRASQAINQLNEELFVTLAKIIDARDSYVYDHSAKVADYATAIANDMKLAQERTSALRQAALLHDIGKIGITEQLLNKPAKLTGPEYQTVKTHATLGADFLETSQGLRHLAPFVRHHHEWWNGEGYPSSLRGEEISMEARILAVCDAVEAMASDRPYHRAMGLDQIIAELERCAATQFDPKVVESFVRLTQEQGRQLVVNSAREAARRAAGGTESSGAANGWYMPQGTVAGPTTAR